MFRKLVKEEKFQSYQSPECWKDVVLQIRGNCYNEKLEQVFGSKALFVLALLSSIPELLGQSNVY